MSMFYQNKGHLDIRGGTFNNTTGPQTNIDNSGLKGIQHLAQHIALNAIHNSSNGDRATCHSGTREGVRNEIINWAKDGNRKSRMYWLEGPAGVGKSAIMRTVAFKLDEDGRLGASFFFSRTDAARNSTSKLFITIAYQLAINFNSPDLKDAIEKAIEHNLIVVGQSEGLQLKKLILEPLKSALPAIDRTAPKAIFIDGLDDCIDNNEQIAILNLLNTAKVKELPILFIISSRLEPHIRDWMIEGIEDTGEKVVKYEIRYSNQDGAEMRKFFQEKFLELSKKSTLRASIRPEMADGRSWPSDNQLDKLVAKASGQYIYATTVLKYVEYGRERTPVIRLQQVIDLKSAHGSLSDLDVLYRGILSHVEPHAACRILGFLYILLQERRAIELPTLSVAHQLVQLDTGKFENVLLSLESLIDIPDLSLLSTWDIREPIFHHASLQDFLYDHRRSGEYFIDQELIYNDLLTCCIQIMSSFSTKDHVHKPIEGAVQYTSCNFFGWYYSLLRWSELRASQHISNSVSTNDDSGSMPATGTSRRSSRNFSGWCNSLLKRLKLRKAPQVRSSTLAAFENNDIITWIHDESYIVHLKSTMREAMCSFPSFIQDSSSLTEVEQKQVTHNCMLEVVLISCSILGHFKLRLSSIP